MSVLSPVVLPLFFLVLSALSGRVLKHLIDGVRLFFRWFAVFFLLFCDLSQILPLLAALLLYKARCSLVQETFTVGFGAGWVVIGGVGGEGVALTCSSK